MKYLLSDLEDGLYQMNFGTKDNPDIGRIQYNIVGGKCLGYYPDNGKPYVAKGKNFTPSSVMILEKVTK